MARILLSPLGRSPGAVSGLYHALEESGVSVDRLIVLATSDPAVQRSADMLREHFYDKPAGFLTIQKISAGDDPEMVDERAVYGFIHRVNAVLYNARHAGDEVHIGIAGGRKSMSALATLSAYVYGAAAVYHFWVHEEIERYGDIYNLPPPGKKREWVMHPSKYQPSEFNQVGEHSCRLVSIPLVPFDRVWDHERLAKVLAENPQARRALLRTITDADMQRLKALQQREESSFQEISGQLLEIFRDTEIGKAVEAAVQVYGLHGKDVEPAEVVELAEKLSPYFPPPFWQQIKRDLSDWETWKGGADRLLKFVEAVATSLAVGGFAALWSIPLK